MANNIDYNGIKAQQGSSPLVLFNRQLNFYNGDVIVFAPCIAVRCYAEGQWIWGQGESEVDIYYGSKAQGNIVWNHAKNLLIRATGAGSGSWSSFFSINNTINGSDNVSVDSNIFRLTIRSYISADGNKAYTQLIGYGMNAMSQENYEIFAKGNPILGCDCNYYTIGSGRDYPDIDSCLALHNPGVYSGSKILASDSKRIGFGFKL